MIRPRSFLSSRHVFFLFSGLVFLAVAVLFGLAVYTGQAESSTGHDPLGLDAAAVEPAQDLEIHPLKSSDFVLSAPQGFGDRQNSVMWAMQWFNDELYVGTNRAWMCWSYAAIVATFPILSYLYPPRDPDVECEEDPNDLPLQAEIWRWTPATDTWEMVFQSPQDVPIPSAPGKFVAREIAFRTMAVFEEADGTPALYAAATSSKALHKDVPPPRILRTTDGVNWEPIPQDPGTVMGDLDKASFRSMTAFDGKLYILHSSAQGNGVILESSDPSAGNDAWQQVSPEPLRFFELQPFNGSLYAGAVDITGGYAVLKMDTFSGPPYNFIPIVERGGYLPAPSRAVVSMEVFKNGLFVGMDKPSEIIRIASDDTWELIIGTPRLTPDGPKIPRGRMDWGFNWSLNRHIWRMQTHNGVLYVGTYDQSTTQRLCDNKLPLIDQWMGFDLLRTSDGIHFSAITLDGFGDPFDYGVRTFASTPHGLFMGTANPYFGAKVYRAVPGALDPTNLEPPGRVVAVPDPDGVRLSWRGPLFASQFRIYRAEFTRMKLNIPGGVLPIPNGCEELGSESLPAELSALAENGLLEELGLSTVLPEISSASAEPTQEEDTRGVLVPLPHEEIGTSNESTFLDTTAIPGVKYSYYVIAENLGNQSKPSNLVTFPILGGSISTPTPTPTPPPEPSPTPTPTPTPSLSASATMTVDEVDASSLTPPVDDDCPVGVPCKLGADIDVTDDGAPLPSITTILPPAFDPPDGTAVPDGRVTGNLHVLAHFVLSGACTSASPVIDATASFMDAAIKGEGADDATSAALADPTVWPTRLESDLRLAQLLGNGQSIVARYLTVLAGPLGIQIPVNLLFVDVSDGNGFAGLTHAGTYAIAVIGDPSVVPPVIQCTPLNADYILLGETAQGETLMTCLEAGAHTVTNVFSRNVSGSIVLDGTASDTVNCSSEPEPEGLDVAIDADVTGNDARLTAGANIQACASIAASSSVDIDVLLPAPGIDAADGMKAYQFDLNFDPSVVQVTAGNQNMLLGQAAGSVVFVVTPTAFPIASSPASFAALDLGTPAGIEPAGVHETGPGVLARITLQGIGAGVSALTLTNVIVVNANDEAIPLGNVSGATVVVDGVCPAGEIGVDPPPPLDEDDPPETTLPIDDTPEDETPTTTSPIDQSPSDTDSPASTTDTPDTGVLGEVAVPASGAAGPSALPDSGGTPPLDRSWSLVSLVVGTVLAIAGGFSLTLAARRRRA